MFCITQHSEAYVASMSCANRQGVTRQFLGEISIDGLTCVSGSRLLAGVKGRCVGRLIYEANPRTQLACLHVLVHAVIAQAEVQRQLPGQLPLILNVRAVRIAGLAARIVNCERLVG